MKHALLLIVMFLCSTHMMAINLVIENANGKTQSQNVSLIGKWLFERDNLKLLDKEGNLLASESVLDIRKIIFLESSDQTGDKPIYEKAILIYPNPTQDILNIKGLNEKEVVRVYDIAGVLLFKTKDTQINVSAYPTGTYLLQIGTQVVRVIKQ